MVSGTHRRVYCYYYYFCCCRHCHLVPIAIEFATPGLEQWPSTRDIQAVTEEELATGF